MRNMEQILLPVAYRLGFENWDSQHSVIISLLQEAVSCRTKKGQTLESCINEIYNELMLYAQNHFKYEEKRMEKIKYDGMRSHIKQHHFFIEKVKVLYFKESKSRGQSISELASFLKSWFLTHIQNMDRKVVEAMTQYEFEDGEKRDLGKISFLSKKE